MKPYLHNKICTLIFVVALLIIIREWKQSRCPSSWGMKKQTVIYLHIEVLLSNKKEQTIDEHISMDGCQSASLSVKEVRVKLKRLSSMISYTQRVGRIERRNWFLKSSVRELGVMKTVLCLDLYGGNMILKAKREEGGRG